MIMLESHFLEIVRNHCEQFDLILIWFCLHVHVRMSDFVSEMTWSCLAVDWNM